MSQSSGKNLKPGSQRLYPPRTYTSYYVLTMVRKELERVLATYLSMRVDATILDFGCGDMPYRSLIEPRAARYLGADLSDNPQATLHIQPDSRLPLDDQSVDAVISTQVLEHVESPANYLLESFRVLKSNGLLILSTHGYWPYHPHPTDLWRWTGSGLTKIIQEAGFHVIELRGVMGLGPTALQLFQIALFRKTPRIIKPMLGLMIQSLIMLADRLYTVEDRQKDACVFVVVAVKP